MSRRQFPEPVAGPLFHAAAKTPVSGGKRRRLLCLIAAFADAGERSPTVRVLGERLGGLPVPTVDALLERLEQDGLLVIHWRAGDGGRNVYELKLPKGGER